MDANSGQNQNGLKKIQALAELVSRRVAHLCGRRRNYFVPIPMSPREGNVSEKSLLEHHMEQSEKRFDKVEEKLDKLMRFMWVFVGISIALSKFGSRIADIASAFAGGK